MTETVGRWTARNIPQSNFNFISPPQQQKAIWFALKPKIDFDSFVRIPRWILSFALCGLALSTPVSSVVIGDSRETVLKTLGNPVGQIELRDRTLMLYPRGEVTLRDDRVSALDLMEPEAMEAEQARLRAERKEWLAEQEKRRAARKAEGEALRAEKLQSTAFATLPAKDRVDYWRSFQARYPEVDVSHSLASALESYQTELAELRNQEQIANLHARVARAEQEAAAARLEASKLRRETEQLQSNRYYGLRYYTTPVISHPTFHSRRPIITIHSKGTTTVDCDLPRSRNHFHVESWSRSNRHSQTID